jgi:hypothetical protein
MSLSLFLFSLAAFFGGAFILGAPAAVLMYTAALKRETPGLNEQQNKGASANAAIIFSAPVAIFGGLLAAGIVLWLGGA